MFNSILKHFRSFTPARRLAALVALAMAIAAGLTLWELSPSSGRTGNTARRWTSARILKITPEAKWPHVIDIKGLEARAVLLTLSIRIPCGGRVTSGTLCYRKNWIIVVPRSRQRFKTAFRIGEHIKIVQEGGENHV
ncbi:MAG: hypothetical protein ACYCS1_09265 [Gammaproteobacteria bacterium]